jgi:hypothetical protein
MTVQHTSRRGKTYYLHTKATKKGNTKHYFSLKPDGELVDAIPDGFEIYENVNGQVFLRRTPKQIIQPEELALVESALRRHGAAWQYRAEIKKNAIVVYECATDIGRIDAIMRHAGKAMSDAEKLEFAQYLAVMRFVLEEKRVRHFTTERFCFKGSIDNWVYVGGPADLEDQVDKYIRHLGQDSFYDLF